MIYNVLETDIEKSFAKQKLVFKESWIDKFDFFIIYLMFGLIAGHCFWTIIDDFSNVTDKFTFLTVYGLLITFSLIIIFRKTRERHLIKIKTNLSLEQNKEILMNLAQIQNLGIYHEGTDFLIFTEPLTLYPGQDKYMIFLVTNRLILFTILHDSARVLPNIVLHLFVKHNINKLLKRSNTK